MKEDEPALISRILELVAEFPRFGYRQITCLLQNDGWQVNAKRIYRLWRQEGLKVPKKAVKRRRLGSADGGIIRHQGKRPTNFMLTGGLGFGFRWRRPDATTAVFGGAVGGVAGGV